MSVLENYKKFNNCFYKKTTNTKARKIFEEVVYINTEYDRLLFFYHTIGKKDIYKIKALLKSFNEYYREFINEKEEEFYYFRNRTTSKYIANDNEITSKELKNVFCTIKKQRNNLIQFKLLLINQLKELQCITNFNNSQPAPIVSEEPQSEELQEAKNVLINGRKPNLLERYQIADRIFNIDKIITRLNVRTEDKYKILAVLLDCNEHNAKKLINRKYPAKTDQKAIKDFINKYLPE